MKILYLNLVILLAWDTKIVRGPSPTAGNLDFGRWRSNSASPSLSSNPCDGITRASIADSACHKECSVVKAAATTIYSMLPDYKSTEYLLNKCGMVTEGKCNTAAHIPVCWCYVRKGFRDQRENTLSDCRSATQIMRKFTNAVTTTATRGIMANGATRRSNVQEVEAVHLQKLPVIRPPTSGAPRPLPPPPPPPPPPSKPIIPRRSRSRLQKRPNTNLMSSCCGLGKSSAFSDDDEPSLKSKSNASSSPSWVSQEPPQGKILYTNVRISGEVVQAMVDTGAAICLIHPNYAKDTVQADMDVGSVGEQYSFRPSGKSTIYLSIGSSINFYVTGFVADRGFDLVLGNDFLITYAAKINLFERKMELWNGLTRVNVRTQLLFNSGPAEVDMTNLRATRYKPLQIIARLNGIEIRCMVDTGATNTIANKNFVHQQIHRSDVEVTFGGSEAVDGMGTARVNLMIGSYSLKILALVPDFIPFFDLILGNDFNEQYVELIDFESKFVTFRFPGSTEPLKIKLPAIID